MQIWVDADACPKPIKDIVFRAAERLRISTVLVANTPLRIPASPFIRVMRVRRGFDVADREIAELVQAGDVVVTADIPLAAEVIGRGGHALDPRGVLYTSENIPERLAVRNLMAELRTTGLATGGPAPWSRSDSHAFANQLDRLLSAHGKADTGAPHV
ncbi:MAG TPA: YaiI/YqxD family protein [Methylomirabilota bacterium]